MGLISQMKADIAKSGNNKKKILYVKSDTKVRIRFLQELDDGYSFKFHDNFNEGINCLCPKEFDEDNDCVYCDETSDVQVRTRTLYAWSVFNYDSNEVEIALFAVNQCTPVNQFITMAESYGTIIDRDYILAKTGKQQTTSYTVIPQDKSKFRNEKAKPMTRDAMLKILKGAFAYEAGSSKSEEDEEEEQPKKRYATTDEKIPFDVDEKKPAKKEKKVKYISEEDMEDIIEEEDIDEDDFLEFMEVESLDEIEMTSKEFKRKIEEYLDEVDE